MTSPPSKYDVHVTGRIPASGPGGFEWGGVQQIQELTEHNAALLQQLEDKEEALERLEERVIALEPVGAGVGYGDGDPRDAKIIELSKRNRALNMALQKRKNKLANLKAELQKTKEIAESKVYPQRLRSVPEPDSHSDGEGAAVKAPDAAAETEAELKAVTLRVESLRMKLEKSQAELKATQRALIAEVGTDVPLATVVEEANRPIGTGGGGGGWKGRAQRLVVMKAKLQEAAAMIEQLRGRLGEEGSSVGLGGGLDGMSVFTRRTAATVKSAGTRVDVDASAKHELQEASREKVRALEKAQEDLEAATQELEETRGKLDGAKARAKILDTEVKKLRGHVRLLLDKTGNDDQLVDAMRAEMDALRVRVSAQASSPRHDTSAPEAALFKQAVDQHARQMSAQDDIIKALKGQIKNLRDQLRDAQSPTPSLPPSGIPRPPASGLARPRSGEIRAAAQAQHDADGSGTLIKFLKADNVRLQELTLSLQQRVQSLSSQQEEYISRVSELEIRCSDAPVAKGALKLSHAPSIAAKVKAAQDENAALRRTHEQVLGAREAELTSLRALLDSVKPSV